MINQRSYMKKFLLIFCAISLTACGPITRVGYNYIPPEDPVGKKCVMKCHKKKRKCERKSEKKYQQCQSNNDYITEINKANKAMNSNAISSRTEYCSRYDCDSDYKECFQLCGGRIETYTYQVDGLF